MKNNQPISKGALTLYQRYLIKKKNDGELLSLYDLAIIALPEDSVDSKEFQNLISNNPNLGPNFLKELDLSKANLSGADLSGANLSELVLTGAKSNEANLTRANLTRADLTRADLRGANLSGAALRGANLTRAILSWADLFEARLTSANLTRGNLTNADLTNTDLRGAILWGADLFQASLANANLTGANLNEANLTGANLNGADFSRADLTGAIVVNVIQETITKESIFDSFNSKKLCEFLNALKKSQKEEILGIGGAPTSIYLKNLLDDAEAKSKKDESKITGINKVLEIVKLFEKELGLNPSTSVRDPRLGLPPRDFLRRRPQEEVGPQGGR
jgi:uncharacterized protein YjbI with pentapeptide repeats